MYALDTNNVIAANNYAATLMMQGKTPALSLQLTSNLVTRFSSAPLCQITNPPPVPL